MNKKEQIEPMSVSKSLKEAAKKEQGITGFNVILPEDFEYTKAKEISNSYFSHKPAAVAFPRAVNQVAFAIRELNEKNKNKPASEKIPLRIMSGGHQHEGMSSANDAFIIRLSDLGNIEYNAARTKAWIPAGMKLGVVYNELEQHNKTIPAGGCMNVNVGGLTQGGGWGMNARKDGLTCDNILAAEVVLANGDIVQASETNHPNLFWAIRGGGGGNFGVVTRFLFKLQDISPEICVFRLYWGHDDMEKAIAVFLEEQKKYPKELTSFLRLTAVTKPTDGTYKNYPVYASGLFHGRLDKLIQLIQPLVEKVSPSKSDYFVRSLQGYTNEELNTVRNFKGFDISSNNDFSRFITEKTPLLDLFNYDIFNDFILDNVNNLNKNGLVAPPKQNCSAPHPHKVSSAFSNNSGTNYYKAVAQTITKYFEETITSEYKEHLPYVRSYMTFHSMGGAMAIEPKGGSAFAFRNTEFLLQFQSWWNHPDGNTKAVENWPQIYIDWVLKLRAVLQKEKLVEGAFINFIDRKVPLEQYYGANYNKLQAIKKEYDSENVFNFQMSIPLATS